MKEEPYILIIDKEKSAGVKLADFLRSLNYQVDFATSGQEALNLFLASHYEGNIPTEDVEFNFGDIKFDSVHQTLGSRKLSCRECEVLLMLSRSRNNLVDRNLILQNVWRDTSYFAWRSLCVYINHLRKHLKEENCPVQILSSKNKGYKLIDM